MPKRKRRNEDSDEYFRRKIRKLESKLKRRRKTSVISSGSSSSDASPVPLQNQDVEYEQLMVELAAPEIPDPEILVDDSPVANEVHGNDPQEGTSTEPAPDPLATPALDEEILMILGEAPSKDKKYAAEIQYDLAIRWEHIATSGLSKDARKDLLEKYLVPSNCKKIEAPVLNPEIKAALTDSLLKKDKALETKQKQQAAAIACLSEALTLALSSEHRDPKIIKLLIETGRIMCDSQHTESLTRRSFICSTIKKELKDQLYDTEIDKFLFGEKLSDTLKAAKAINKSASDMKTPAFKTLANKNKASTSKNFKFPQTSRPYTTSRPAVVNSTPARAPPARRRLPPQPQQRSSKPRAPAPRR